MADKLEQIQTMIYQIRGQKVMLDLDLAVLYQMETKNLNKTVKRNLKRFPADFMFQLNDKEWANSPNYCQPLNSALFQITVNRDENSLPLLSVTYYLLSVFPHS